MAITFPNSPSSGDTHTTSNGLQYTYDGEKWTTIGTNSAGTWTRTGTTVSLTTAGDDLNVDSGTLFVDASTNNVGVGTTSPSGKLDILTGTTGNVLIDAEGGSNFHAKIVNDSGDLVVGARSTSADTIVTSKRNTIFKTGSSEDERLRINSSGNVGIGTTSPSGKLNIKGSDSQLLNLIQDSGDLAIRLNDSGVGSAYIKVRDNTGASLSFDTGGSERLRIDSSGNVGIGKTSSGNKLEIEGQGNTKVVIDGRTDAANGSLASLELWSKNSGGTNNFGFIDYDGDGNFEIGSGGGGAGSVPLVFKTNATERMRIDSSGNVKVGTPATVFANAKSLSNYIAVADNYTPGFMLKVPDLYSGEWSFYLASAASATSFVIADDSAERMRIDSSGRLLVGRSTNFTGTNAQYGLLQISGNSAGSTGDGRIVIGRGEVPTAANQSLGQINFVDNTAGEFASIKVFTDGSCGTNDYPGRIEFHTTADGASSPTERMRIASNGNVYIGGGTSFGSGGWTMQNNGELVSQYSQTNDIRTLYNWSTNNNGTNTSVVYVQSDGKIYARTTTLQAISSERRLKENINLLDADAAWETIKSVPFYSYNFIGADPSNVLYGPMADEVPDEMRVATSHSDDVGVIHTYDNGMLQARLYVALQAALKKIETLEQRLTDAGIA